MLRLLVFDISEPWPMYFRKEKCLAFDIRVVGTQTATAISFTPKQKWLMLQRHKRSDTLKRKTEIPFLKSTENIQRKPENYHQSTPLCMVNVKIYPERTGALRGNKTKQSAILLCE